MKRYRLLKKVILGFIRGNEQTDERWGPADSATLECDGHTIWITDSEGTRHESITEASAIDFYLRDGYAEEVVEPPTTADARE